MRSSLFWDVTQRLLVVTEVSGLPLPATNPAPPVLAHYVSLIWLLRLTFLWEPITNRQSPITTRNFPCITLFSVVPSIFLGLLDRLKMGLIGCSETSVSTHRPCVASKKNKGVLIGFAPNRHQTVSWAKCRSTVLFVRVLLIFPLTIIPPVLCSHISFLYHGRAVT
jgi:hypothetical protein